MKTLTFLIVLTLILSSRSSGQFRFAKTYGDAGNQNCTALFPLSGGGYLLAGSTGFDQADSSDVALYRLDAAGDLLWSVRCGGPVSDFLEDLIPTADGGFIATGVSIVNDPDSAIGELFVARLDSLGNLVWAKTYGGPGIEQGQSIRPTDDGGFLVAGFYTPLQMPNEGLLMKIDSVGNLQWARTYTNDGSTEFFTMESMDAQFGGGFFAGGSTLDTLLAPHSDVTVLRLDPAGDLLWQYTGGGTGDDYVVDLAQASDGGLYFCGVTQSVSSMNFQDNLVAKVSNNGNLVWSTYVHRDQWDITSQLVVDQTRNRIFITGHEAALAAPSLLVTDTAGNFIEYRKYNAFALGYGQQLLLEPDAIMLAGKTDEDVFLLRTDAQGVFNCPDDSIIAVPSGPLALTTGGNLTEQTFNLTQTNVTWQSQPFVDQFSTVCSILSAPTIDTSRMLIYPNPAGSSLQVQLPGRLAASWTVYSGTGQSILCGNSDTPMDQLTLPLVGLPDGVYFLELRTAKGVSRNTFVKQGQ